MVSLFGLSGCCVSPGQMGLWGPRATASQSCWELVSSASLCGGTGLRACGPARDPASPTLSPPPPQLPREACPQRSWSLLFKSGWGFLLVSRRSSVLSTWATGGHRGDLSSGPGTEWGCSLSTDRGVLWRDGYAVKTHPGLGHGHWPLRGPAERRRPSRPESECRPGPCSRGGRSWPGQRPRRGENPACGLTWFWMRWTQPRERRNGSGQGHQV